MRNRKQYEFILTLKHQRYATFNVISILMCLMAITAFVVAMLHIPFQTYNWINVFLIAIIFFSLLFSFINRNREDFIVTFKWPLFAAAFLWLLFPLNVISIAIFYIIAALLERQVKFPQEIGFGKDEIRFNTFPERSYEWNELKNVMLKDDLLTLDFLNNKIIQREIEPAELTEEENEFNEFCRKRLNV